MQKVERGEIPEVIAEISQKDGDAGLAPLPVTAEPSAQKKLLREHVVARYDIAELKKAQNLDMVATTLRRLIKESSSKIAGSSQVSPRRNSCLLQTSQRSTLHQWARSSVLEKKTVRQESIL